MVRKKGIEGLGFKALSMCRKSCLLILPFSKIGGGIWTQFFPWGGNFNKPIFKVQILGGLLGKGGGGIEDSNWLMY